MSYLILEIDTGFMDGWYSDVGRQGMLEYWDEARPGYHHILLKIADNGGLSTRIPDNLFLGAKETVWHSARQ